MIKPVLKLHKKIGETPLECLERFRLENPEYAGLPMTYAGRLDPLASGELLVLTGEECKNRQKYLSLNKVYRVKLLFGVATDTHDVLGLVNDSCIIKQQEDTNLEISKASEVLEGCVRKFTQDYPDYSSKTIKGQPLFSLAKKGLLDEIEKPTKEVEIFKIEIIGGEKIISADLHKEIERKIGLVNGDFRQNEILEAWKSFFDKNIKETFEIIEIEVDCSSGTYMRSLADRLGKQLSCGAIAWEIERIKSY